MKLWDKGYTIDKLIEDFTSSRDRELDVHLAPYDVIGSIAHAQMLESIGMITHQECNALTNALKTIEKSIANNEFEIEEGIEDVHSQVEKLLVAMLGETGKKIHLARSRNDQILTDLRLYYRHEGGVILGSLAELAQKLLELSREHQGQLMPGYTHSQLAMVSSFGLWFSCFAEAFIDDIAYLKGSLQLIDSNPLGTAAGYGSSIPVDRIKTTELLLFNRLCVNPIYAQITRGKSELWLANSLSSIAYSLNKLCSDLCLYSNENYKFFSLPREFTTGSSIMPHKKNPDVFELIRARTNLLIQLPNQITALTANLITGYHRDFQLLKELMIPALSSTKEIVGLIRYCLDKIEIIRIDVSSSQYKYMYSVDTVNDYVKGGMSFRDAYRKVADEIESGNYNPQISTEISHIGSVNNLGIEILEARLKVLDI